jgi:hypothetical protein
MSDSSRRGGRSRERRDLPAVTTGKLLAGPFVIGSLRTVFVYQAAEPVRHSTGYLCLAQVYTHVRQAGSAAAASDEARGCCSGSRTRSGPVAGAVLAWSTSGQGTEGWRLRSGRTTHPSHRTGTHHRWAQPTSAVALTQPNSILGVTSGARKRPKSERSNDRHRQAYLLCTEVYAEITEFV